MNRQKKSLENGKHALCENPLVMNSKESGELAYVVKKTGLFAAVNYNLRFYPICQEAKARIEAGEGFHISSTVDICRIGFSTRPTETGVWKPGRGVICVSLLILVRTGWT